jgi:DNA-directed RNA polymerase specialized sigma24 family protein
LTPSSTATTAPHSKAISGMRPERRGTEADWSILRMMARNSSVGHPSWSRPAPRALLRSAYVVTGSHQDAEDVVQVARAQGGPALAQDPRAHEPYVLAVAR